MIAPVCCGHAMPYRTWEKAKREKKNVEEALMSRGSGQPQLQTKPNQNLPIVWYVNIKVISFCMNLLPGNLYKIIFSIDKTLLSFSLQ